MPPDVLGVLHAWEPTTPRLTWYGEGSERVELSGRVLTNWVVKAANLLHAECGVGAGGRVLLDLPAHWRLLVWTLGSWAAGADVRVAGVADAGADADVVVTARPDRWTGRGLDVIAAPLPALARSWPGPLPPAVVDGAAELMGQPDQPVFAVARSAARFDADPGDRLLLVGMSPGQLLDAAWSCWSAGGSVVVVGEGSTTPLDRIAEQEAVTGT